MKKIIKLFNFIYIFFFKKKILCLINAPQQYFSLVEFVENRKLKEEDLSICIGYCSESSQNQIKELENNYYFFKNIFFLKKIMNENYFKILLNIYKIFSKEKDLVICGDFKYYLFQPIYRKSKKVIFLDEGVSLLNFEKLYKGKNNYELFSIFKNTNSKNGNLNKYNFMRKKFKEKKVEKRKIFLLGCYLASFDDCLNEDYYITKINSFAKKNSSCDIYFIPHRNEREYDLRIFEKNIKIVKIDKPIETYLINMQFLPSTFAAFYSMALINLDIIFNNNSEVNIINLSFPKEKWISSYHRENFEKFEEYFKQTNIKNIQI